MFILSMKLDAQSFRFQINLIVIGFVVRLFKPEILLQCFRLQEVPNNIPSADILGDTNAIAESSLLSFN